MFNERKFRAAVVLAGLTMEQVAKKLDISVATLYRKIKRDGDFNRAEIQILGSLLPMKAEEIFFEQELAKTQEM